MIEALQPQPGHGYGSSKTYAHSVGFSCTFRQWRAKSHCRFLHGYALQVRTDYGCHSLDEQNWCEDFGGLKPYKAWLTELLDHKTLVASDDPELATFQTLADRVALIQLVVVPSVGVEAFSRLIFDKAQTFVSDPARVWVERVTISEHEGNSAWYGRKSPTIDGIRAVAREVAIREIDHAANRRESSRIRTNI
jgi:6-pyruvoyltetrahydropterin/6-carboxytetrahydropterin synthase